MDLEIFKIKKEMNTEINIERSVFIGHSYLVEDKAFAKSIIKSVKNKEATHHCSAYIIGRSSQYEFCDDNGEPSGSAGFPILNAIKSYGVTNTLVIVTRYYGGKKLGVRGLIEAYGRCAKEVLELSGKIQWLEMVSLLIITPYQRVDSIMHYLDKNEIKPVHKDFQQFVTFKIELPEKQYAEFSNFLQQFHDVTFSKI